jgi:hypothetical protein
LKETQNFGFVWLMMTIKVEKGKETQYRERIINKERNGGRNGERRREREEERGRERRRE